MWRRILSILVPYRDPWWPTLLKVTLFWSPLLCGLITLLTHRVRSFNHFIEHFGISLTISTLSILISMSAGKLVAAFEGWIERLRGQVPKKRGLAWHLIITATTLPLGVYAGLVVAKFLFGFEYVGLRSLALGVFWGLAAMMAFLFIETLQDLRDAKRRIELQRKETENERLRGKLKALTAQMNPHLLFNSLNTIAALAHSDPSAAESTTVELADLYRGVLRAVQKTSHSLAEELALCRAYLNIESTRFNERLRYQTRFDNVDLDTEVPPLILQPLVENAIKHGIAPKADGGQVQIEGELSAGMLHLVVRDDGIGMKHSHPPRADSTALNNLSSRLSLRYGAQAKMVFGIPKNGGTEVTVSLPTDTSP